MATAFAGYVVARNDGRTTLLLDERPVLGVGHEQMFASDPDGNASNAERDADDRDRWRPPTIRRAPVAQLV
jgi:hypothetical protein